MQVKKDFHSDKFRGGSGKRLPSSMTSKLNCDRFCELAREEQNVECEQDGLRN